MNSQKVIAYSSGVLAVFLAVVPAALSQTPAVKPVGTISAIDAEAKKLTIKTDAGPEMAVILDDATAYLRIPLGETSVAKGEKIEFKALNAGDRVIAQGAVSADQASIKAKRVIVMILTRRAWRGETRRRRWRPAAAASSR